MVRNKMLFIAWLFYFGMSTALASEPGMDVILANANHVFSNIYDLDTHEASVYVATDQGIYQSSDYGKNWQPIPSAQLPLKEIQKILYVPRQGVFAASATTVYHWHQEQWRQIYKGTELNPIKNLDIHADGTLMAATTRGLIAVKVGEEESMGVKTGAWGDISYLQMKEYFQKEPDVRLVQDWAIQYADVHPGKIQQWRHQIRRRAWLPSLDVGVDGGRDWSFNDSIWGSSSGNHHIGPDDKSFGSDIGFDVSLSWDLGDIVWSNEETSIDNRSKLMVELREDVLDQVTRLYYERRRLQMEMYVKEGSGELPVQNYLRVDELTALIDGFTDGKFSQAIRSKE